MPNPRNTLEGSILRLKSASKRRSNESLDSASEVEGSSVSKTSSSSASTAATDLGSSWSDNNLASVSAKAGVVGAATSVAGEAFEVTEKNQNQVDRPPIVVEDLKEALSEDGAQHLTQGITGVEEQGEEQASEEEGVEAAPHIVLQASVTRITDTHVLVTPQASSTESPATSQKKKLWGIDSLSIPCECSRLPLVRFAGVWYQITRATDLLFSFFTHDHKTLIWYML